MSLPTGSFGQSWRLDAYGLEFGLSSVGLPLPVTHSVWYKAPLGLYYGCAGNDLLVSVEALGYSASIQSITVLIPNDGQWINLYQGTTLFAGLADTVIRLAPGFDGALSASLGIIEIWYAFTTTSIERRGLFITDISNPHLSLDPFNWTWGTSYGGDIYMSAGDRGERGLKIVDYDNVGNLYTGSFITAIVSGSVPDVSNSVFSGDYPLKRFVAARGFVADRGFVTVVSGGIGALVENATWNTGFVMNDSGTITITEGKLFIVPTGSVYLTSSLNSNENRIYIRGNKSTFEMNAVSASAFINSQPWVYLTSSVASVVDEGTDTPIMYEGAMLYVIPATGTEIQEAHIRSQNQWWSIPSASSFTILDGGTY